MEEQSNIYTEYLRELDYLIASSIHPSKHPLYGDYTSNIAFKIEKFINDWCSRLQTKRN